MCCFVHLCMEPFKIVFSKIGFLLHFPIFPLQSCFEDSTCCFEDKGKVKFEKSCHSGKKCRPEPFLVLEGPLLGENRGSEDAGSLQQEKLSFKRPWAHTVFTQMSSSPALNELQATLISSRLEEQQRLLLALKSLSGGVSVVTA